jgi:hypothetical protein
MSKNKYITTRILSALKNDKLCRDSYMRTIQVLHDEELNFMRKDESEYYKLFFNNKLSSINTIKRIWSKIQEVHLDLRGENYEERKKQSMEFKTIINKYGKDQLHLFDDLKIIE